MVETDPYAEHRETWAKMQDHYGLSGLTLAGRHAVLTPEQDEVFCQAVPQGLESLAKLLENAKDENGDLDFAGFVNISLVVLKPGEHRVFSDDWAAANIEGRIYTSSPRVF